MKYIHALNKNTYIPIRVVDGGVEFMNEQTGDIVILTNYDIENLSKKID